MLTTASFAAGSLVGLSIAAPVGPMALLCVQRTIASGMMIGFSTGLGAATANLIYGSAVLVGLEAVAAWVAGHNAVLSAMAGLILLAFGVRILRRRPSEPLCVADAGPSPLRAYGSAAALNLVNPISIMMILAQLSPLVAESYREPLDPAALLAGLFLSVTGWWLIVTGTVALLRRRLSTGVITTINRFAGLLVLAYAVRNLARSAFVI